MNRRLLLLLGVFLWIGLLAACGRKPEPKISHDAALELAISAAKQGGYDPEKYKSSAAYEHKENQWVFNFKSRSEFPAPGDHYMVIVNAENGKAALLHGQ